MPLRTRGKPGNHHDQTPSAHLVTLPGTLRLSLCGPWKQHESGKLCRQEVLWDDITATGTTIENGGFESAIDKHPDHWEAAYYPPPIDWPRKMATPRSGEQVGVSWHNRMLSQNIPVESGKPVTLTLTLTLHARAATLPGFAPPKRLGNDTPAHRACARLKRGVNLGNCWEAPPRYRWGIRFTPEDIGRIAAEGFDHIRVPVAWHHYLKPGDDGGFAIDPQLLNEPHGKATTGLMNEVHDKALQFVRKTNPQRIVVITPTFRSAIFESQP